MIEIEDAVFPSPDQWDIIVKATRNPMNSWDKMDSEFNTANFCEYTYNIGYNDMSLMERLSKAGTDHGKFLRMIPVFITINAPLYWWKEADTYKVGTVANSCSTMHKIHSKEFVLEDFSTDHLMDASIGYLKDTIEGLNRCRDFYLDDKDKDYWWQMIQLLPSSYNQKRTVMLNYAVLKNMYYARKNHKLDEWKEFCKWIEAEVPYADELICNEDNSNE